MPSLRRVASALFASALVTAASVVAAAPVHAYTDCSPCRSTENTRTGATNTKVRVSTCITVKPVSHGRSQVTASTTMLNDGAKPARGLSIATGVRKNSGVWSSRLQDRDRLAAERYLVTVGSVTRTYRSGFHRLLRQELRDVSVYFAQGGWRYYRGASDFRV